MSSEVFMLTLPCSSILPEPLQPSGRDRGQANYNLLFPSNAPAAFNPPRKRFTRPPANCRSRNPSICRENLSPYPYHQTLFTPGKRSESRYLILTISSNPNFP